MSDEYGSAIERPTTGCELCDEVNLSNATHGIMQAVSCRDNDIGSVDEAIELIRKDVEYQLEDHAE